MAVKLEELNILRTSFHYPSSGNSPASAPIFFCWQGNYHLFYSSKTDQLTELRHAFSPDMVHWNELPVLLKSSPNSGGKLLNSAFSPSDRPIPTLLLAEDGEKGWQLASCQEEDLVFWKEYSGKRPSFPPPADPRLVNSGTGSLWVEENSWYMVEGAGHKAGGGAALLYSSPDLLNWQYLGILYRGDCHLEGERWDNPNFFALGNSRFLLVSSQVRGRPLYFTGSYEKNLFSPHFQARLEQAGTLHFPQTFEDGSGRRLMLGWIQGRGNEQTKDGEEVMSLPLVLSAREDTRLGLEFVPELESLRGNSYRLTGQRYPRSNYYELIPTAGGCLEIKAEIEVEGEAEFGIVFRTGLGGEQETRLTYNTGSQELVLEGSKSGSGALPPAGIVGEKCPLENGRILRLHLYLDRTVIEVIANGWFYLASRMHQGYEDSTGLGLFCESSGVRIKSLEVWRLVDN